MSHPVVFLKFVFFYCRGDAARRPEARMAQHPRSDAEGLPPHGAGGARGKHLLMTVDQI